MQQQQASHRWQMLPLHPLCEAQSQARVSQRLQRERASMGAPRQCQVYWDPESRIQLLAWLAQHHQHLHCARPQSTPWGPAPHPVRTAPHRHTTSRDQRAVPVNSVGVLVRCWLHLAHRFVLHSPASCRRSQLLLCWCACKCSPASTNQLRHWEWCRLGLLGFAFESWRSDDQPVQCPE